MAKLTAEQQKQLDDLQALAEAPDEPGSNGRSEHIEVMIDLSDEAAVERGIGLGFLTRAEAKAAAADADDDDAGDDDGAGGGRRKKAVTRDGAPRRRVTGADKWAGGDE
jgi:hypothetical protein